MFPYIMDIGYSLVRLLVACLWVFIWFLGSWILHLKISGLCFGSPVPGMWVYVLSLVGLLVALFVGIGCCVACWFCLYVVILYRAEAFS